MQIRRAIRFFFQRLFRGWDDSDTWSLNTTIAEFIYPRLKRFKEVHQDTPCNLSFREWNCILDKMLFAFGYEIYDMADEKSNVVEELGLDTEEHDKIGDYYRACWDRHKEGMELFVKYYRDLWW